MRGVGVRVDEMRVDVERHQLQGLEGRRVHDGHVVGRVDAKRGHVGPGRAPDVEQALLEHPLPDQLDQIVVVQALEQLERVAAPDEDGLGLLHGLGRVLGRVDRGESVTPGLELLAGGGGIVVLFPETS